MLFRSRDTGQRRAGRSASDTEAPGGSEVVSELLETAGEGGEGRPEPGMERMREAARDAAIVVTKIDKLSRTERLRAIGEYEAVFEHAVAAVSAVTGEGLDELWILIDRLANNSSRRKPRRSNNLPKGKIGRAHV